MKSVSSLVQQEIVRRLGSSNDEPVSGRLERVREATPKAEVRKPETQAS